MVTIIKKRLQAFLENGEILSPHLKIAQLLIFGISILAIVSMIYSCWFLRPLTWDGGRFTFFLFHNQSFYTEFRPLHGLFQIPILIALKLWKNPDILFLARIYFLIITIPVLTWLSWRIYRAQNETQLALFSSLLIIGYIPAFSYIFSSIYETAFFFFLAVHSLLFSRKKVGFFLCCGAVAFGHPTLIAGFMALLFLIYKDDQIPCKDKKWQIMWILICTACSFYFFVKSLDAIGTLRFTLSSYFNYFFFPNMGILHACSLFGLLLLISLIKSKYTAGIQLFIILLIFWILDRIESPIWTLFCSHHYRLWTAGITIIIAVSLYLTQRFNKQGLSNFFIVGLVLLAIPYLYREIKLSIEFRNNYYAIKNIPEFTGCKYATKEISDYTLSSTGFFKIFVDNKREVDSILLNAKNPKGQGICEKLNEDAKSYPIVLGLGGGLMGSDIGYFDFEKLKQGVVK